MGTRMCPNMAACAPPSSQCPASSLTARTSSSDGTGVLIPTPEVFGPFPKKFGQVSRTCPNPLPVSQAHSWSSGKRLVKLRPEFSPRARSPSHCPAVNRSGGRLAQAQELACHDLANHLDVSSSQSVAAERAMGHRLCLGQSGSGGDCDPGRGRQFDLRSSCGSRARAGRRAARSARVDRLGQRARVQSPMPWTTGPTLAGSRYIFIQPGKADQNPRLAVVAPRAQRVPKNLSQFGQSEAGSEPGRWRDLVS